KLEIKQSEVETKQKEQKQFKYFLPNLTEELRTSKQKKYNLLQAEIEKLQAEISEIVGEIGKIKAQIGKSETIQNMLTRAEELKKDLEKSYEDKKLQFKNDILKSLHSLDDITSAER
ncbi:MAG: hypothetical protein Q8889_02450, partial [Candidatus Phytoplasma australasiaticum]|nr:hypothetical protein [Candidatus Phytoplasma australasiaticum]